MEGGRRKAALVPGVIGEAIFCVSACSEQGNGEGDEAKEKEDGSPLPPHRGAASPTHAHSFPSSYYRLRRTDEILMVLLGRIMNMLLPGVVCMSVRGFSTPHTPTKACNIHACNCKECMCVVFFLS